MRNLTRNEWIGVVVAIVVVMGGLQIFGGGLLNDNSQDKNMDDKTNLAQDITKAPVTELKMADTVVGTGKEVKSGDTVTVNYTGKLLDGTVFDSSIGRAPFETQIGIGRVIKGWDVGIVGMKVGGKRTLVIPADMAYGARAIGSIPANSPLIFDVELLGVK